MRMPEAPQPIPASVEILPEGGTQVPDWLRELTPADAEPAAAAPEPAAAPIFPQVEVDNEPEEAARAAMAKAAVETPQKRSFLGRAREVVGKTFTPKETRPAEPIEPLTTEAVRERSVIKNVVDRARRVRDGIRATGARVTEFADRLTKRGKPAVAEAPAETPEAEAAADEADRGLGADVVGEIDRRIEEARVRDQAARAREARLAEEQRQREEQTAEAARLAVEQGIKDEAVEAYRAQVAAETAAARLAEEQRLMEEQKAEAEKLSAEQAQREAEEAARLEEVRQQAEARKQRYEALKTKTLDDNQVELLVRGVVGRDADGNRSPAGMIEDTAQVMTNELAAAQQKELAVREGINQAQELMVQKEAELQQQRDVRLGELRQNAEERLQLPGMREELLRVGTSLQEVTGELDRLMSLPARLQKTYAAETAKLRAEKAGFTAKKNGLNRIVTQLEAKAAKFVAAQTPEVETWHQTQLLQAGREVQTFVDQQEGYDRADVEAWTRMELDTTIHEAGVALDNLERWQKLAADPEGVAKQIAEVQAQQDMLMEGVETRITGLNGDVAKFTENLAEAKEIQKRAKNDKAKERAKIEVKRAEVALADAQAELDKNNKELKRFKKARKAAVNAKMSELLPAELLEEEGVNYGGEMAVTSYEGETTLVPLGDIVKGNRGRRKEVPREAATQVGKLAEFVIWGGEAMEPDESGNPVPIKVKGLYEREGMKFAGMVEAELGLARQRLEQQASGETKEAEDVNIEIGRALEQAGEGARKAVELVIKASGENQLENISPENKRRLGEMIGSIATEMVNQAAGLVGEAAGGKTPEVQQKIGNWAGAVEMILDNAPAEAGNLAGLRGLVETLKNFAQ